MKFNKLCRQVSENYILKMEKSITPRQFEDFSHVHKIQYHNKML